MEHQLERVEKYLEGMLSETERLAFEQDLEQNEELRSDLKYLHLEREAMAAREIEAKELAISQWNREFRQRKRIRIGIAIGSLVAITLIMIWLLWPKNTMTGPVAALYEPIEDLSGLNLSRDGSSPEAVSDPGNTTVLYLEAHRLLQNGKWAKAESAFLALTTDVNYGLPAEWYAILAYYLQDDTTVIVTPGLANLLDDPSHPYHRQALQLAEILQKR